MKSLKVHLNKPKREREVLASSIKKYAMLNPLLQNKGRKSALDLKESLKPRKP